jgi:hypothetical protein
LRELQLALFHLASSAAAYFIQDLSAGAPVQLSLTGRAPPYLSDLLIAVSNLPNQRAALRSADRGDLYVPATHLKLGRRAFSVVGPLAWNRLLLELRTIVNTTKFK